MNKKKISITLIEIILKILWIIPIRKRRVVFICFNGTQYSDSPKYIYKYLSERTKLDLCWILSDEAAVKADCHLNTVRPGTVKGLLTLLTAKSIVTNNNFPTWLPIRSSQVVLNTWHGGGAFKKIGLVSSGASDYEKWFFRKHEKKYTAFISDSMATCDLVIEPAFGFKGEVLKTGLPRNVILLENDTKLRNDIRNSIGIDDKQVMVLYAPTFRGSAVNGTWLDDSVKIDYLRVKRTIENKTGKTCKIFYRGHHALRVKQTENIMDVSDYPDMQELLLAADCLLTDYSSCMWDMSVARKPVFLYAPDLKEYLRKQGFFTDPAKWPFTISETNDQLEKAINDYDSVKYGRALDKYLEYMGSFESINATHDACEWLISKITH